MTLVTNRLERGSNRLPINMITARRAAVASTGMEMTKRLPGLANGRRLVLFLDIHMKSVQVEFQDFAADIPDHFESLVTGVDEVSLKAIERFEAHLPPAFFGLFAQGLKMTHDSTPLLF